MTERNKDDQIPTSETEGKQPDAQQGGQQTGQQGQTPSEGGQSQGGSSATGETRDAETLTQTEQPVGEETGEQTGEGEGGFVASKKTDEESDYLQKKDKSETDIEGSSKNFGTNGE